MKNCKRCGKPFEPRTVLNLYCSPECYNESNKEMAKERQKGIKEIEKQCICCGKSFTQMGHRQIYCSPECGKEMRRTTRKKVVKPKKEKKPTSLRELTIEARKHGMTYGKYVAWKERGIKP